MNETRLRVTQAARASTSSDGLVLPDVHGGERVRRTRVNAAPGANRTSADDIVWAVDEACVWYVKRATCLQRSAVATWMLRRRGVPAVLDRF